MSNWNGKYVTTDSIIERLFRNADYRDEVKLENVVEWVGDCIGLIGYPAALIDKITDGNESLNHPDYVEIVDYRGILPSDAHQIIGVRDKDSKVRFRLSSDTYHLAADNNTDGQLNVNHPSYQLKSNFIFTDVSPVSLEIAYKALPVSSTGLPLIPDEVNYMLAVEWYIREKIDYKLFRKGSLQQGVYQHTEQQLTWYMGKAQTAMQIPSEDEMEAIQNIRLRLRPQINDWSSYFKSTGIVEQRNNQNKKSIHTVGTNVVFGEPGADS